MKVCQDAMEANLDKTEPNPGENQAAVERRETLNEEVAVHPLRACRNETMACQETMEARLEEEKPAPMELKPEVADEVPLEDAVVMSVGEPRKRRRTDDIWPRGAARRRNRNGPRRKMGARRIWSQPAVQQLHGVR
jgi:hypothetical protein